MRLTVPPQHGVHLLAWGADPAGQWWALVTWERYIAHGFESPTLGDAFLCGLGLANAVTRMVFAMGRDLVLPSVFARTHPKHKTPYIALIANLLVSIAFVVVLIGVTTSKTRDAMAGGGGPLASGLYVFGEGLTIIPPPIMLGYLLLCIAGIARATRAASRSLIILSIGGVIASAIAVYGSLYFSFVAGSPGAGIPTPYAAIPWLVLGWLVVGALIALWLKRNRPAAWAGMGAVFE